MSWEKDMIWGCIINKYSRGKRERKTCECMALIIISNEMKHMKMKSEYQNEYQLI